MMTEEQLKQEIADVLDMMRTADDLFHDYLVGELRALLRVRSGGKIDRPLAFERALRSLAAMRKQVKP